MVKTEDNRANLKAKRTKEGKLVEIAQRVFGDEFSVRITAGSIFIRPREDGTIDYLSVNIAQGRIFVENSNAERNAYVLAKNYESACKEEEFTVVLNYVD